jgi:hypothetical protein
LAVCVYRSLWTLVGNIVDEYSINNINAVLIAAVTIFILYSFIKP